MLDSRWGKELSAHRERQNHARSIESTGSSLLPGSTTVMFAIMFFSLRRERKVSPLKHAHKHSAPLPLFSPDLLERVGLRLVGSGGFIYIAVRYKSSNGLPGAPNKTALSLRFGSEIWTEVGASSNATGMCDPVFRD